MRALLIAVVVAGACGGAPPRGEPVDRDYDNPASAAREAFDKGDLRTAADLYERALRRARVRDEAALVGDAAHNLAVCLMGLRRYDRALDLVREARDAYARGNGDDLDAALLQMRLNYARGDAAAALELADGIGGRDLTPARRAQVHLVRGEIACDRKERVRAAEELAAAGGAPAGPHIRAGQTALLEARRAHLAGRLHELADRLGPAATAYELEAGFMQQAGFYGDMAAALARAGRLHPDAPQAADLLYRAARCYWARRDAERAAALLADAAARADPDVMPLIAALEKEMKQP
ncbi:MAG: hypothetical protein OER88_07715 [Planctomycetota bacterium]|nr:hypothetical protein [Planctomycetota bacterium]